VKRHLDAARGLVLLLALAGALALAVGCTETPVETAFDNPFDPDNPDGGDPFDLIALYVNDAVFLTWQNVGGGVTKYLILHSTDGVVYADLDTVSAPGVNYAHLDFAANRVNWYKVRGLNQYGQGTSVSAVTPATFLAPPRLTIGAADFAPGRHILLSASTDLGDRFEVDSLPDFSTSVIADFDEEGRVELDWDLGEAVTTTDWKHVYYRVDTGGILSPDWHDSIQVRFDPALSLLGNPATVGRFNPTLAISGDGVTAMRFAPTRADLATTPWEDPAETWTDHFLTAEPDSQWIFGEFRSDFGFAVFDSVVAVPDSLVGWLLVLNGGADATSADSLRITTTAVATDMRFATSLTDLVLQPWIPYATPAFIEHDGCASAPLKTVYVQLRNDWFTADAVSASIQWLPPEALGVAFTDPGDVSSGQSVLLAGTAVAGTCSAPLDRVEVDTGAGWETATGLETWTFAWTAPVVLEETSVTLYARVTAGEETHVATLDVMIAPAAR
jgi:hypothetical protein